MAFGLLALGKVPTAWLGMALATSERVGLQLQIALAVAFTDAELLNSPTVYAQSTPSVLYAVPPDGVT